ncbi:MAG: hypothetical protein AAB152_06235 [Candidatus Coatesbacteria bacterium]
MKTAIDNSALARIDSSLNDETRAVLLQSFSTRKHSFYATNELATEVLAMDASTSRALLSRRTGLLLRLLASGRVLNHYGQIIQGELEAESRLFADSGEVTLLKEHLGTVSATGSLGDLRAFVDAAAEKKRKAFAHRHVHQDRLRRELEERGLHGDLQEKYSVYEAFEAFMLPLVSRDLAQDYLKAETRPLARRRLETLHEHLDDFPYTKTLFRITTARMFWNWVMNRRVDSGDLCDDEQLVYMAGLDLMVTEDQRLQQIGGIIFPDKKIIGVEAFCELL